MEVDRAMKIVGIFAGVALALLIIGCGGGERQTTPPSEFFLPIGDADAGRQAFQELDCYACHQVEGDSEMPAPADGAQAPTIGSGQAGQSRDRIANSIVSPHQDLAPPRGWSQEMPDFRVDMSVQQLIDLVSFVSSRAESASAR